MLCFLQCNLNDLDLSMQVKRYTQPRRWTSSLGRYACGAGMS